MWVPAPAVRRWEAGHQTTANLLLGNPIGHFLGPHHSVSAEPEKAGCGLDGLHVGTDRQIRSCLHIRDLVSLTLGRPSPQPVRVGSLFLQVGNQGPERARQSPKVAKPLRSTPRQYQRPRGIPSKPGRSSPLSRPGHGGEAQGTVQGHSSKWLRVSGPPLSSCKACYMVSG